MTWILHQGDAIEKLKQLEAESINCCVTSPPYWRLRDYGVDGQMGLESTPDEYVTAMVEVFREVKRILRKDGTLWLNMGDCYAKEGVSGMGDPTIGERNLGGMKPIKKRIPQGIKPKDMVGIPWRLAFALRADGWWLRSDIIWSKPNPMPESVTDRPTKSHEYLFLMAKSERYYYDYEAIKEPSTYLQPNSPESIKSPYGQGYTRRANTGVGFGYGTDKEKRSRDRVKGSKGVINNPLRNKRSVWTIPTKPFNEAHFATFPPKLIVHCILAGCPEGGTVIDPFAGAGTTMWVSEQLGRNSVGIELNPDYCEIIRRRMSGLEMDLFQVQ